MIKSITTILGIALALYACDPKNNNIEPKELVGEWAHTYQIQTKEANGNWSGWNHYNALVAIPNSEFTIDGRYMREGKEGAECCTAGNKYAVAGTTITFSDTKSCPQMSCRPCNQWEIVSLNADSLILEMCDVRNKFARVKK
ncbi:hypothetical protein [Emticicia soli]|uniref:Lipocalin-like domain-containing protein n=1 Tax=Emticicia soli TaxID=2027878 RepID=A0ABW5J349_9BACT